MVLLGKRWNPNRKFTTRFPALSTVFEKLSTRISQHSAVQRLFEDLGRGRSIKVVGVAGSLRRALFASWVSARSRKLLYVTQDPLSAEFARDDFRALLAQEKVGHFPEERSTPLEYRLQSVANANARLSALELLMSGEQAVIVTTATALTERMLLPSFMERRKIRFRVGQEIDFNETIARLINLGFVRETIVDRVGEMSVRGGIVDVFPFSRQRPIRIEFFGDTVETMREFDPQTQRSICSIAEETIYPQFPDLVRHEELGGDHESHKDAEGTLLDYLGNGDLTVLEKADEIEATQETIGGDVDQGLGSDEGINHTRTPGAHYGRWRDVEKKLEGLLTARLFDSCPDQDCYHLDSQVARAMNGDFEVLRETVDRFVVHSQLPERQEPNILFLCDSAAQQERVQHLFAEEELDFHDLSVEECGLHEGFLFLEAGLFVITSHGFFSRARVPLTVPRPKEGFTFRQLRTLNRGDYVAHVDFGIGVYDGLRKIMVDESERECIQISYYDNDKVYVPLERMDRVRKYSSREGVVPRINRLGSLDWQKLKSRTRRRLKDISAQLITLYAERRRREGFAFSEDHLWQHELEASFVYDETPDQLQTIHDVKEDMESNKPMDRLVCGDVGFGKTEVAVRASFKAVIDGKQVALLAPTTILANQHYLTFKERLEPFPVRVEMLSRFRTKADQQKVVSALREGRVDVVIGTHRLLSSDVRFKDLGLLIIDEEQRFGVRHKERLKKLRAEVDVLTLTATPIPRTLHMALIGVSDMSRITTPPRDRLPIRTEVIQFNEELLRQAILRETGRGGQIFFVHNRVQSIGAMRGVLRRIVPEARFAVAHGQMHERHLEKVMEDFIARKFDCLVSTVIIQSGVDIPNVNTLIVNRADRFGLSQLYQLRGRVGRSTQQAYAYLIVPTIRKLSHDAIKRLQAIEEITELGSGYQLALRDLEVRGAGNLLGAEQSGFVDALGYDLFCKILDEAVSEVKGERGIGPPEQEERPHVETHVQFQGNAYLPESYVAQPGERVDLYRRLIEAKTVDEADEIRDELRDRFGHLPTEAENLLDFICVKILGNLNMMTEVKIYDAELAAEFSEFATTDQESFRQWVEAFVAKASLPVEFSQGGELSLRVQLGGEGSSLRQAKNFLQSVL